MKLAAVVVTYNRKELLMECLDSILQQTHPVDAIVLIDNGSTDNTIDALNEQNHLFNGLLHYVRLEENIGPAAGFLKGMQYAEEKGFDWLWIMDDDVIPSATALENLLRHAQTGSQAKPGLFFSYQTRWRMGPPCCNLPKSIKDALLHYLACPVEVSEAAPIPVLVDWCPMSSLLIPREVFAQVGWPRQEFYVDGDDIEYAIRIRKAGYPIYLIPDSVVDHRKVYQIDESLSKSFRWRFYYTYRNQIAIIVTHRDFIGRGKALAALLRISLGALRRMFLLIADHDHKSARLVWRAMIDGYSLKLGKISL